MRSVSLGMGQHLSVTWDPVRNAGFQALPQTCCTRNMELGCRNLCSNTPGDKGCRYSWRTTGLGVNKDKYWEWLSSSLWSVSCPPHFVCHRALSSWAMGCVHRTCLYTSEFFSSVSTCGKKRQNPLSPTFCPRTYFLTSVVHTRLCCVSILYTVITSALPQPPSPSLPTSLPLATQVCSLCPRVCLAAKFTCVIL